MLGRTPGWAAVVAASLVALVAGGCRGDADPTAAETGAPPAVVELQERWWAWAASSPTERNPVADTDGRWCDVNQPSDVWFLAGTFGDRVERNCTVPAGRPLAFPLVNIVGAEPDCAAFMTDAEGSAVWDGTESEAIRLSGERVEFEGAPGNPLTASDGPRSAVSCGLWVQLPPPDPGRHTLRIRGWAGGFSTAVDYTLTVTEASSTAS
ncbi:signal protein [Streptomyces sp. NPDC127098]|uniref:signal protein n=1 Tax=Streptomyces sp. NPDC127098 TaxID=3347137 RepID=UPI003650E069